MGIAGVIDHRTHMLLALSRARIGREQPFSSWCREKYAYELRKLPNVVQAHVYEPHPIDITCGKYPPLPFTHLAICDLILDGTDEARTVIEAINQLHQIRLDSEPPATWLFYPLGEKVRRGARDQGRLPMLTIAFANGVLGREDEFREWYCTRHIRHALTIPALVSGQCFARTVFQDPGALELGFSMVAIYEQDGTPEALLESLATLPPSTFDFPAMDDVRFAEAVCCPVSL